jgi:hypothetical protein
VDDGDCVCREEEEEEEEDDEKGVMKAHCFVGNICRIDEYDDHSMAIPPMMIPQRRWLQLRVIRNRLFFPKVSNKNDMMIQLRLLADDL